MISDMVYGIDDCCFWISNIIKAHGGQSLVEPFLLYDSKEKADYSLKQYGNGGLLEACQKRAKQLKFKQVVVEDLIDGDIGIVTNANGHLMALRFNGRWIARTKAGVAYIMDSHTILAWRVPCLQQ